MWFFNLFTGIFSQEAPHQVMMSQKIKLLYKCVIFKWVNPAIHCLALIYPQVAFVKLLLKSQKILNSPFVNPKEAFWFLSSDGHQMYVAK